MSQLGSFIWGTADILRGPYKASQYGNVILPMTILRRLDCVLEEHRTTIEPLVERFGSNPELLSAQVQRATGLPFYNTSPWTLKTLLGDPKGIEANLKHYVNGFSDNMDVFERFKLAEEIATMAEKNILYIVVERFSNIDLHPKTVTNAEMGDLYEYLIRTFNESSNEAPGEHFTPRDAIRLLVDLVFAGDDEALSTPGAIRSIYDPTVGTGGMLSIAEEHLIGTSDRPGLNPQAQLRLYGQEWNDHSYAVCKSDLLIKGYDSSNIQLGDTLADDKFAGQTFDYCMSNPPYGDDWKASQSAVMEDLKELGSSSRFYAGGDKPKQNVPAVSDGQMLFLQHVVSKLRPKVKGGGRGGIVMNGSPLFNGAAESGPSNIRKWMLEHDLVDAIVALPTDMFYNTGIATYIWIVDNNKPEERQGKVQLIDGTEFYEKMRKKLGDKGREISEDNRATIVQLYDDYVDTEHCKIVPIEEFAYWLVTVERPRRDEHGEVITNARGKKQPDTALRDTERVPFTYDGNTQGDGGRQETIRAYFDAEVKPYVPDAWVDEKKTKIGYEIPFTRFFYRYQPPRPLEEIDAELHQVTTEILQLLNEVTE
ncbi:type I restriction-modification system subunit M [Corynebacterium diphtheriae]|uniref:type I restriction-modification system subunit M n=1 Tax=Corynebacterium diphtheriae TaxID=1717 RepID=UPI00092BC360|nr:class I SAM-dependent DNA methyltransferase [Corynebacterium diphtheriae]OJI00330.1 restriction endonuclease subunit M [Corynebacterium diphtheriae]OSQ08960.1 restriction endonuclease subunit M [Corynebacterium diphtheriae]OSQ23751.1 restriction endonuclease subunit M [Corynebacterium diphtheriae]RKX00092.1 SAM-dependent DNA methyltransferase [Corynebacterium diphtheriae]UJL59238.1 SAM-dependent DNA methyltransferase [Corynebacterium diphtheriae]